MENNLNQQPGTENAQGPVKSSLGMEENVAALLCYLVSWVTGLIFLLCEKNSKFVKFNAAQSLFLGITYVVVCIILHFLVTFSFWPLWIFFSMVNGVLGIGFLVLSIIMMVKAYHKETVKLPVIGDIAETMSNK